MLGNLQLHDPTNLHYGKLSYYSNNDPNSPHVSTHCFQLFDTQNDINSWYISCTGINGYGNPLVGPLPDGSPFPRLLDPQISSYSTK